jgi:AhpC/TSA family
MIAFLRNIALPLVFGLCLAGSAAAAEIGAAAPQFTGTTSTGQKISLNDFAGKTVVLEWTNDGCPYVRKHYGTGNMQALQKEATAEGVVWLSVISSAPGKQGYVTGPQADELTKTRGAAPSYVVLDPQGTIGKAYEAKTTPHMFIVDGKGILRFAGGIDDKPTTNPSSVKDARNYVREALADLKAGKPIAVTDPESYGCSIKYGS